MDRVDHIFERFRYHGGDEYGGERVTQLAHALQCATFAEEEGAIRPW